jgi:hypothetical protein
MLIVPVAKFVVPVVEIVCLNVGCGTPPVDAAGNTDTPIL